MRSECGGCGCGGSVVGAVWVRCGCGVGAVWVRCARHGLLARRAEGVGCRLGGLEEDLVRLVKVLGSGLGQG